MKPYNLALMTAFLTLPTLAQPIVPLPATGEFIYSNACLSPGGDFAGYRMRLSRSSKNLRVRIEFNDDGPDGNEVARDLKFNSVSGALSFSFRSRIDTDRYVFHGIVTKEKLVGAFDIRLAGQKDISRGQVQTLPAIETLPKYLPSCDPP